MTSPIDVLVAVPAHDEAERIESCLTSVAAAALVARRLGHVRRIRVAVGAHRCTDETAAVARRFFAERPEVHGLVCADDVSVTVGGVRRAVIAAALGTAWHAAPGRTWIFNTDADSTVPPEWIASSIRQANRRGAAAAVGLVELDAWAGDAAARLEYENLIAAGMRPDGHDHVYGANLAVRLDAYLAAGGFESVDHGEDHALLRRLRRGGWPIRTTTEPVVVTAGRMPGRAADGLGGLLQSLASQEGAAARRPNHLSPGTLVEQAGSRLELASVAEAHHDARQ